MYGSCLTLGHLIHKVTKLHIWTAGKLNGLVGNYERQNDYQS